MSLVKENPQLAVNEFVEWAKRNPQAIHIMRAKAEALARKRGYVSANYLVNWLRNETSVRIDGLDSREFKVPNHFATILSRYLAMTDPELAASIRQNSSAVDGCTFPSIGW